MNGNTEFYKDIFFHTHNSECLKNLVNLSPAFLLALATAIWVLELFHGSVHSIKALKTLVWPLSREPMKEISSFKRETNSNV